jgi:hypothetical protein
MGRAIKPNNPVEPTCPQCLEPLELAHTALFKGHAGIEDRTYKCSECGHSESWVVSENTNSEPRHF